MSSFVAATTAGRSQCGNWSPDGVPFSPNGVKRHRHRRVRLGSLARSRRSRSPGTRCRGADAICDHDGAATLTSHVPAPNNSFLLMQKQRQHQQLNAEVFRHRRPSHSTQTSTAVPTYNLCTCNNESLARGRTDHCATGSTYLQAAFPPRCQIWFSQFESFSREKTYVESPHRREVDL